MADIWGDGLVLSPHTLTAGADGTDASAPPHTVVAGMDGLSASVPPHTISASGTFLDYLAADLPIYALESELFSGAIITAAANLLTHTLESEGEAGFAIILDETLPAHALVADFGWFAANDLPVHALEALHVGGQILFGDLTLPVYTLEASDQQRIFSTAGNSLPVYVISASAVTGGVGSAALLIPTHRLLADGYSGAAITASNELPTYVLVAAGYGPYTLAADVTLPLWELDAEMSAAVVAAFRAWATNLRKRATTEYTNFQFNSFAELDGRVFAAGPAAIHELGDFDDDDAAAVSASMRTGKHHFGTTRMKRIPRIYLGAAATGALEFRTITGADGARAYLLPWNQSDAPQLRRVPIGRGPKSTYWQFELLNREGSTFDVDAIQLYPETGQRRASGV